MSAFLKPTPLKSLLLVAASGLALAGCKIDNRPFLARSDQPVGPAALPEPGPIGAEGDVRLVQVGQAAPASAYPYAERAYAMDRAFYDMPPDYAFGYGDEQPWVWEAADDNYMFAEPYGDDYRYYYYEPGYDYPYFVRDADYGYAYGPNGALLALFTAAGALIAASSYDQYYPAAHGYWSRGHDLHQDFGRAPRQAVSPQAWSQRAPVVTRSQQTWLNAPARQPQWRQWRASGGGQAFTQRVAAAAQPARIARGGPAPRFVAQAQRAEPPRFDPRGGRERGVQGQPAPDSRFDSRFAMRPQGGPPIAGAAPRSRDMQFEQARAEARAQGRAERGFARGEPAPAAPSVQEHGRAANVRAPDQRPAEQAAPPPAARREWRGGGDPHAAAPAPSPAPQAFAHGGGHDWHGGGQGGDRGGGERMAQAAPQPQPQAPGGGGHGGGGQHGSQPQPRAAPAQHGNGGGHGQGNDRDKKH
jgi:hypothetical protein